MIKAKINYDQVDESRLFQGKKGRYLDVVLIDSPQDNSDGFIKQDCTKEEREQGVQMPIIGSFKRFDKPKNQSRQQPPSRSQQSQPPRQPQPHQMSAPPPQPARPPQTPFRKPEPPKDPDLDPPDSSGVPF